MGVAIKKLMKVAAPLGIQKISYFVISGIWGFQEWRRCQEGDLKNLWGKNNNALILIFKNG